MIITHPNITSPLFKLVDIYEMDIKFYIPNDEVDSFTFRVEMFASDEKKYRFRSYRTEMYRLKPRFPVIGEVDDETNVTDQTLFVSHGFRFADVEEFYADSPEDALKKFMDMFSDAMKHVTSEEIVQGE